jgi:hypothetical protein
LHIDQNCASQFPKNNIKPSLPHPYIELRESLFDYTQKQKREWIPFAGISIRNVNNPAADKFEFEPEGHQAPDNKAQTLREQS